MSLERFEGDIVLNPEEIIREIFEVAGAETVDLRPEEWGRMVQMIVRYGDQWKHAGYRMGLDEL